MTGIHLIKTLNVNHSSKIMLVMSFTKYLLCTGAGAGGMRMNKMWPPLLQFCLFKKKSSMLTECKAY